MADENLAAELKTFLLNNGANMVGFADLRDIPPDIRNGFPSGISIAIAIDPGIVAEIREGPTSQYVAECDRVDSLLDSLGSQAVDFLKERGYGATFIASTDAEIDCDTLSTRLPYKTVATRAGHGWIGKCALLVTDEFGEAIRITSIFTDAILPYNEPVDESRCGECTACVDACPSRAPSGRDWKAGIHRDSFLDAFACLKTGLELTLKNTGKEVPTCGICIAVCPLTEKYIEREAGN